MKPERIIHARTFRRPVLCATLLTHVRDSGFNVGRAETFDLLTGKRRVTLDVSKPDRSENWLVHVDAENEYEAIIDLMQQLGFELEE